MNTTFTVDGTEYTVTFRHLKTIFPEIFSTVEPDSTAVSRVYGGWEQRMRCSGDNSVWLSGDDPVRAGETYWGFNYGPF